MQQHKKEYLELYGSSKKEIERLEIELQELKECEAMTKQESRMQQEIEKKIIKERHLRITRFEELREKIEKMKEPVEKDILVYRHIKNMKWEEIEKKMGYEKRQLTRIYNKAVEHLEL